MTVQFASVVRRTFAAALLLAAVPTLSAAGELQVVETDPPADLAAFALEDHHGRPFTRESLEDGWDLILIGYTTCPDVCPFVLSSLAEVRSELSLRVAPESLPRVVFVGVDPDRDQPVLADYVGFFDPSFLGVTGDEDEIAKFVETVGGFASLGEPDASGEYEVSHSAAVFVVAPDGRVHAKIAPPFDPVPVADYLARLQIAYRRGHGPVTQ